MHQDTNSCFKKAYYIHAYQNMENCQCNVRNIRVSNITSLYSSINWFCLDIYFTFSTACFISKHISRHFLFPDSKTRRNDLYFLNYLLIFLQSGPNLDLFCVQQLNAAPFCENYAKLYFEVKHLEKELKRECWDFWGLFFFTKSALFGQYRTLP